MSLIEPFESDPRIRVEAAASEVVVTVRLPGMTRESLTVAATARTLTLAVGAERAGARRHGSSRLRRAPGALVRRVALPEPVRPERASAVLASGVLVVRLPRLRPSRGRRIEIE